MFSHRQMVSGEMQMNGQNRQTHTLGLWYKSPQALLIIGIDAKRDEISLFTIDKEDNTDLFFDRIRPIPEVIQSIYRFNGERKNTKKMIFVLFALIYRGQN